MANAMNRAGRRRSHLRRVLWAGISAMLVVLAAWRVGLAEEPAALPNSDYAIAQAQPFNRVETYPLQPLPTSPLLRPVGNWVGRLILPSEAEYAADPGDWAWFEVWHGSVDFPELAGQVVKLTWKPGPDLEAYLAAVTRDLTFTPAANRAWEGGMIVPKRLDGRRRVGPLQSLAGARPFDDVTVRLTEVELVTAGDRPVLRTGLEPIQISGREYGLVQILEPDNSVAASLPEDCPGDAPCPTEFFRVQFYNPDSQDFSGPVGTVRIPQQPRLRSGRFQSNLRDLIESPAGREGWYIYGARDSSGMFTVQALKPRSLMQLQPDQVIIGRTPGLNYIDRQNWRDTPRRQGTLQRVLVSADGGSSDAARASWQEGDFALLIHLFGGIGGENGDFAPAGTVTGHFSYGLARVVREPITNELQFDVNYQQVYAHSSGGILSGTHDWNDYIGDMQRGWLGIRPVSDVVVKLDAFIQPFEFEGRRFSLFRELLVQTQIMAARYRTGDGTGIASVTPAVSCVQDSNQALFIAIQQVRRQLEEEPEIQQWLRANPADPEAVRARQFIRLGTALGDMLTPYGVIRPDWQDNAEILAGVAPAGQTFENQRGLISGALSWQNMMPRWSHDQVARIFLQNGADLWFLRPNMVGGYDASVFPIPPTGLFGGIPVLGRLAQRSADAFVTGLTPFRTLVGLGLLGLYALVALPYGFKSGFLAKQGSALSPLGLGLGLVRTFFIPALVEEMIFRVWILPHPIEGVPMARWLLWGLLSLGLFVVYHPLMGKFFYKRAYPTFTDRRFLGLMGGLGVILIAAYRITGSLWVVTLMHWVVVVVWLFGLGGLARLTLTQPQTPNVAAVNP